MSLSGYFLIYIGTIVVTRFVLSYWPRHAPKIGTFQLHHYMYGLVLVAGYLVFPQPLLLAVGLALFVDEVPLFFIFKTWDWPDNHWKEYHSRSSVLSIVVISVVGFLALYLP